MRSDWFERERLHFAAADGDLGRVKELVEAGYDINAFDDDLHRTPLHYACESEHLAVVQYLLSQGANPNLRHEESFGNTPLGAVAGNCSYELAALLVSGGADPRIGGWMHITALDRSRKRKKEEGRRVYELLLNTAMGGARKIW